MRNRLLVPFLTCLLMLGGVWAKAACTANFSFSSANCPVFGFTDLSTSNSGPVSQWSWTFGDGGTSTLQNPSHTYATNGTYNVCLVITTQFGCGSQVCFTVTVNCIQPPACQSMFQANTSGCPQILFQDLSTSTGTITSWNWTFGDGGTSTSQNPAHTYLTNGNYAVCLSVGASNGCQSVYCDTIAITCNGSCNAAFQFTSANCPSISFMNFSSSTNGTITGTSWTFGDGGTSTVSNPNHTYTANGTYNVCLTITTNTGCSSTFCQNVTISCIQPPACQAAFQYTSANCPTVAFFNGSTTTTGTITGYAWTFGDGSTGTGPNPSHTYAANGTYNVCLSITTSSGCSSTACQNVTISCIQPPGCQAAFQANTTGCPQILFQDFSTAATGSTVVAWNWTFGDGGTSSSQNPAHTYLTNGNYVVCLSIATSNGCASNYCDTIAINCNTACNAAFQYTSANCPTINFLDFSNTSSGTITGYYWQFGDGGTASTASPSHTYTANGSYTVCLTITTSSGCTDTYCQTVTIGCIQPPACQAAFQANLNGCPQILFQDFSTADSGSIITQWFWTFGDGGSSTVSNPAHTYAANGSYFVCLNVVTSGGCQDVFCDTIVINCLTPPCQAAWWADTTGCPNIQFWDQSQGGGDSIVSWSWTFGDGSSSTSQNPTHTYVQNGNYVVCLTIQTQQGCQTTACDTVSIGCAGSGCQASFVSNVTPNLFASFTNTSTATNGTITSYQWTFGDGGSSIASNPGHIYQQPGNYLVCLTIGTNTGCTSTYCDTIQVGNVAVDPRTELVGLQLAPNPFAEELRLSFDLRRSQWVTVSLVDMLGREVLRLADGHRGAGTQEIAADTRTLARGTYLLRIRAGESATYLKVVRE